ncbi:hypothetical protein MLD38_009172 [Melastoma candidum]|uniref:Uncharacterized protein n=1 Tax=Melastoma candidum TaxID=119954 RepID=A0ACB9RWE4_9MYRT|nr:hypothetical protein MLD38_009172 [Melastoma candidum]
MDTEDRFLEVRNWRFYFVKLHEFRNPDLVQIEELLDLRFAISQTREEAQSQKNRLQSNLRNPSYYNIQNWNLMKDGLRTLQLCIDDRIRIQLGTSDKKAKEAERHVFPHLHGSSNLAKERKTMNEARGYTLLNPNWGDYDQIMQRLEFSLAQTRHDPCNKRDEIILDIGELSRAKEEALSNAGRRQVELPESPVSREVVEKKIKVRYRAKRPR